MCSHIGLTKTVFRLIFCTVFVYGSENPVIKIEHYTLFVYISLWCCWPGDCQSLHGMFKGGWRDMAVLVCVFVWMVIDSTTALINFLEYCVYKYLCEEGNLSFRAKECCS